MLKETEKYLINRVKELEIENTYLKGKGQGGVFEPSYLFHGKDANVLEKKAEAFDKLVELLKLEACNWVEKGYYTIGSRNTGMSINVDEETFKQIYEAINL